MKKRRLRLWNIYVLVLLFIAGTAKAPGEASFRTLINALKLRLDKRVATPFVQAFFPPHEKVDQLLCDLIDEESEQIDTAAFQLTDGRIARALSGAHGRGVKVTIVADVGALGRFNKVVGLFNEGVPVFIYPQNEASQGSLMHNKIMLLHSLECIVTGSMNFTRSGMESNQENLLIIQHQPLFKEYVHQFKYLVQQTTPLGMR